MRGNLKDNQAKLDSYEKSIKAALERKRKVIMESKQIAYDMLSELYGLEGQELVDTATIEHTLIGKLTASGMTYDQIAELADDSSADAGSDEDDDSDSNDNADYQTTFFDNKHTPYSD
ncbi:MAG: hypothetical protein ACI4EU_07005 [Butyrivibrio sp.]